MVVLQGDLQQARLEFEQAMNGKDRDLVTLLVVGGSSLEQKIAQLAENRAQALPYGRRVIWIMVPEILTDQEKMDFGFVNPDVVVCVLNSNGDPVIQLDRQMAQKPLQLEKAFLQGQTT